MTVYLLESIEWEELAGDDISDPDDEIIAIYGSLDAAIKTVRELIKDLIILKGPKEAITVSEDSVTFEEIDMTYHTKRIYEDGLIGHFVLQITEYEVK